MKSSDTREIVQTGSKPLQDTHCVWGRVVCPSLCFSPRWAERGRHNYSCHLYPAPFFSPLFRLVCAYLCVCVQISVHLCVCSMRPQLRQCCQFLRQHQAPPTRPGSHPLPVCEYKGRSASPPHTHTHSLHPAGAALSISTAPPVLLPLQLLQVRRENSCWCLCLLLSPRFVATGQMTHSHKKRKTSTPYIGHTKLQIPS